MFKTNISTIAAIKTSVFEKAIPAAKFLKEKTIISDKVKATWQNAPTKQNISEFKDKTGIWLLKT